jgi:hypothetical protein
MGGERASLTQKSMDESNIKVVMVVFFDRKGTVHHEFVRGQMVNKQLYQELLGHSRDALHRKRPEL